MSRIYGVVPATVIDQNDPEGLGRVRIRFDWMEGKAETEFARIAGLMGGKERGSYIMPEVGDEVLVAFENGSPSHPYVIGFLHSQNQRPPVDDPHRRIIRSVNGHEIELYDPEEKDGDKGYIRVKYGEGNQVELSNSTIRIECNGTIAIRGLHVFINGRRVVAAPGNI